jgi:multidrug resistance efflux pump
MSTSAPPERAGGPLVSPDQLDRLLTLVRPRMWVVLAALVVLVGLIVVWGFAATVRVTAPAGGVVQRGAGLRLVEAPAEGRVVSVGAGLGVKVSEGDTLVTLERADGARTVVVAPFDATVVDQSVNGSSYVAAGDQLVGLEPTAGAMYAVLAVAADRRSDLRIGQAVEVRPDGQDSELGYIKGQLEQVDPYPADADDLTAAFGSQSLVDAVAGDGPVYLAQVRLKSDPGTASGLDWSSRTSSDVPIEVGQPLEATVVVTEESPVDRVFP